ncbi:MAG: hypothetical protein HeimC2_44530 [Candidatus Heimdallarchaeota archaeon LC_2]|nr:MAG: hypothetical protein HeimC2_44530 [Candidatus Heimdallarchaeota archaeon LC_2]
MSMITRKIMSVIKDEILENLVKLEQKLHENGPENFTEQEKKEFWRVVGKIKRMDTPNKEYIEKAPAIREILHEDRFGKPVPLRYIMVPLALSALLLIIGNLIYMNDNENLLTAGIITYISYAIVFVVYFHILNIIFINKITTYSIISILSAIELIILHNYFPGFLRGLIIISVFGVVAVLYPHGRWISSKITNIKLDGAIRDIYFFITLKTDYKSYLSVSQKNRHWFFIIPGIGTLLTATIIGIYEWFYYDIYAFLIIALILMIAEIYSYIFDVGVWGGELGHARRERLILKDIKLQKSKIGS